MSIEILVAIVIILAAAVIIISFFSERLSHFSKDVNSCSFKGGFCASKCSREKDYYEISAKCPEDGDSIYFNNCCVPMKAQTR